MRIGWLRADGRRDDPRDTDFAAFVAGAYPSLCRTAYLVVGDLHLAEDVVQNALVSVYRKWDCIEHEAGAGPYARRAVVNAALSELRRPHRRRESACDAVPEQAGSGVGSQVDGAVLDAVRLLPPRQRAVVVLRYVEDADVATTAAALGISEGTVKSQCSKALTTLRGHLSQNPALRPATLPRKASS